MANSPTTTEVLALVASIVSAVGGGFAAWAAWQSARSARHAQESADSAGRRLQLLELTTTAAGIVVEVDRIKARAISLNQAYRDLATLPGGTAGSREKLFREAADEKGSRAEALAIDARLFVDGAPSLQESSAEDIDRVQHRLSHGLKTARAMREDMDSELAQVRSQCTERHESMDRTRLAR